jgi:hypothetical protein
MFDSTLYTLNEWCKVANQSAEIELFVIADGTQGFEGGNLCFG